MKALFLIAAFTALLIAPPVFAGCSEGAYLSGCSSCAFDNATKKFDRSCTDAKKSEGTACLATSYPVAMNNYRNGNCSMVDECISQLNSCTASVSSGNEKADCEEGSMTTCYATADICFRQAAGKCSALEPPKCDAPIGIIIVAGGAALWAAFMGRKAACIAPAKC